MTQALEDSMPTGSQPQTETNTETAGTDRQNFVRVDKTSRLMTKQKPEIQLKKNQSEMFKTVLPLNIRETDFRILHFKK